jgi:hypothetical protein
MVKFRINGGTPEEGVSLCVTCSYGLVRRGFSAAQEEIVCRVTRPTERVPFRVRECSEYEDRRLPNLYSMQKIAWVLLTKSAGRSIGFVTSDRFRELEGEDAEIIPLTACDREERK